MVKKLIEYITQEEFEKLFKATLAIKKRDKYKKHRALCMLLAFEAGLRISEIVGLEGRVPALTKENIDLQRKSIRIVSGKGQKDRIVPLPKRFNQAALKLLPIPFSRRRLQKYVTDLGAKVLNKKISFHTLRHGFGSHLAGQGRPLHEIQLLMGHSRLDTTGVYLHANPKKAIEGAREAF